MKRFQISFALLTGVMALWIASLQFAAPQSSSRALFYLTQTGTFPLILISLSALSLLFLSALPRRLWFRACLLIVCSMALTQGLKTVLKPLLAVPRPYVQQIAPESASFYALSRPERAAWVAQAYATEALPDYLLRHRMHETGYSMPSGHSLFALSIMYLCLLLWGTGSTWKRLSLLAFSLYAALMLYSRVALGMHSPADLALSLIIAASVHLVLARYVYPPQGVAT